MLAARRLVDNGNYGKYGNVQRRIAQQTAKLSKAFRVFRTRLQWRVATEEIPNFFVTFVLEK